jgi:hypothetical protein
MLDIRRSIFASSLVDRRPERRRLPQASDRRKLIAEQRTPIAEERNVA